MLRKTGHILLTLFLFVSTSGIAVSMHYCGGELVSASINKVAKSCCDESGGCCENKTVHFKLKSEFVNTVQVNNAQTVEQDVLLPALFVISFDLSIEEEAATKAFHDSSPPPTIQTRLALLQTYLC